jgi:hypothetical protein
VVAAVSSASDGVKVNAGVDATNVQGLDYSQDAGPSWQLATITDGTGQGGCDQWTDHNLSASDSGRGLNRQRESDLQGCTSIVHPLRESCHDRPERTATAPATMSVTTGQSGSAPANSCTRGSFLGKFRLLALLVPCGEFRGKLRERGGESFVRATGKCYPNRHLYDHGNRDCAGIGQSVPLTLNLE